MNWNQSNNNLFMQRISFRQILHYGSGFTILTCHSRKTRNKKHDRYEDYSYKWHQNKNVKIPFPPFIFVKLFFFPFPWNKQFFVFVQHRITHQFKPLHNIHMSDFDFVSFSPIFMVPDHDSYRLLLSCTIVVFKWQIPQKCTWAIYTSLWLICIKSMKTSFINRE